ncbi:MAG TPA: CPBP family intramembrane metalloprotease [Anaerolineae bacterium]|nr:CPBP family intramembrane metalloprotease [Anaerolineae bacterium]HIQ04583.1 CPBP family intramembrane metalloprotease [Anaerolineae bacterium]
MSGHEINEQDHWYATFLVMLLLGTFFMGLLSQRGRLTVAAGSDAALFCALVLLYFTAVNGRSVAYFVGWVRVYPERAFFLPLGLLFLYLLWAVGRVSMRPLDLELALFLVLIPTALVWREQSAAQGWGDIVLGWGFLLIPLVIGPFHHGLSSAFNWGLRAGALSLPALFVVLGQPGWFRPLRLSMDSSTHFSSAEAVGDDVILTPVQPRNAVRGVRLLLAVMYVWYSVEFGALPQGTLGGLVNAFDLIAIVLVLYLLALAGWQPRLGLSPQLARTDAREVGVNFGAILLTVMPLALLLRFVAFSSSLPSWLEMVGRLIVIFAFTGLPEEILFRGVIHNFIADHLGNGHPALFLSSLIFGAAHLDNPPEVWVYCGLAAIAGWFYGRTYLRTGKVITSAVVHTLVDWVWSVFFSG